MNPRILIFLILISFYLVSYSGYTQALSVGRTALVVYLMETDKVVVARIIEQPNLYQKAHSDKAYKFQYQTIDSLKGDKPEGQDAYLSGFSFSLFSEFKVGDKFILFLDKQNRVIGGTKKFSDEYSDKILTTLPLLPEWSKQSQGLMTALLPREFVIDHTEDLDLFFLVKNVSDKEITLHYQNLPVEKHTHWELVIKAQDGSIIEPQHHPSYSQEFLEEFTKTQGHKYSIELKPGRYASYIISRFNTAKIGWGYKERLNFNFYPLPAGKFKIKAIAKELLNGVELETDWVTLTVK